MKKIIKFSIIVVSGFLLFGCANKKVELPDREVNTSSTKYEKVLRNLNTMVAIFNEKPIYVIVNTIKNETSAVGKLPNNISTMVDTSFNSIGDNVKNIIKIVDANVTNNKNTYHIYGAITKYDVLETSSKGTNFGVDFGKGKGEGDGDGSSNIKDSIENVGITFNASTLNQANYIPRVSTKNEIKIYKKSNSSDFGFTILGSGFGFSNSVAKIHGIHGTLEILVDLSVVELLGKIVKLPYWLLTGGKPNSDVIEYLSNNFYQLPQYKKIKKISYLLSLQNSSVKVTDTITKRLNQAIISYKRGHNISNIDNYITKELYLSLLNKGRI